jgi:hypothetical protein
VPSRTMPMCFSTVWTRRLVPGTSILEISIFSTPSTTPSLHCRPTTVLRGEAGGKVGTSVQCENCAGRAQHRPRGRAPAVVHSLDGVLRLRQGAGLVSLATGAQADMDEDKDACGMGSRHGGRGKTGREVPRSPGTRGHQGKTSSWTGRNLCQWTSCRHLAPLGNLLSGAPYGFIGAPDGFTGGWAAANKGSLMTLLTLRLTLGLQLLYTALA